LKSVDGTNILAVQESEQSHYRKMKRVEMEAFRLELKLESVHQDTSVLHCDRNLSTAGVGCRADPVHSVPFPGEARKVEPEYLEPL
jgi:hypothetical protein